jgi:hypothetical protein
MTWHILVSFSFLSFYVHITCKYDGKLINIRTWRYIFLFLTSRIIFETEGVLLFTNSCIGVLAHALDRRHAWAINSVAVQPVRDSSCQNNAWASKPNNWARTHARRPAGSLFICKTQRTAHTGSHVYIYILLCVVSNLVRHKFMSVDA